MRTTFVAASFLAGLVGNAQSSNVAALSGYTTEGCYTNATLYNEPALGGIALFDALMTVRKCAAATTEFSWFGVSGSSCFGGNSLNQGSMPTASTACTDACSGNSSQTCGAANTLNMYSKSKYDPAPVFTPFWEYSSMGCYPSNYNGQNVLGNGVLSGFIMSVELCSIVCEGYSYFGLTSGNQCRCGKTLVSGLAQSSATECNIPCSGDGQEKCGGNSGIALYQYGASQVSTSTSSHSSSTIQSSTSQVSTSSQSQTTSSSSHSSSAPPATTSTHSSSTQTTSSSHSQSSSTGQSSSTSSATSSSQSQSSTSSSHTSSTQSSSSSHSQTSSSSIHSSSSQSTTSSQSQISSTSSQSSSSSVVHGSSSSSSSSSHSSSVSVAPTISRSSSVVATTSNSSVVVAPTTMPISSSTSRSSTSMSTSSSSVQINSTSSQTSSQITTTTYSCPSPLSSPLACNKDNCLREMMDQRFSSMASTFCGTYTQSCYANPTVVPTYLGNCGGNPTAVSSACSCFITSSKSSTTSLSSTTASVTTMLAVQNTTSLSQISSSSSPGSINSPAAVTSTPSSTLSSVTGPITSAPSCSLAPALPGYSGCAASTAAQLPAAKAYLSSFPACAQTAVANAFGGYAAFTGQDNSCLCGDPDAGFQVACALQIACPAFSDIFTANEMIQTYCGNYGGSYVLTPGSGVPLYTAYSGFPTCTVSTTTCGAASPTSSSPIVTSSPIVSPSLQAANTTSIRQSASNFTATTSIQGSPSSVTLTTTSAAVLATPITALLALYVQPIDATSTNGKRQTYNTPALIGDGSLTADCSAAHGFQIQNGNLYDDDLLVTVAQGTPNALFAGSSAIQSLNGTFSVNNGVLRWSNPAFTNGQAQFCSLDGLVLSVFNGQLPTGCIPVYIGAESFQSLCPGTSSTTSSSLTSFHPIGRPGTTTSSSAQSTATVGTCAAGSDPETETSVLPAANPNVDSSSLINLAPSDYATLYYAQPAPGTTVIEVEYAMLYPQVTLENSKQIDTVQCSGNSMTITFANQGALNAAKQWPQSNLILITNSAGCNPTTQRGVYKTSSYIASSSALTMTLQVSSTSWATVSSTMEISYGVAVVSSASSVPFTPRCTASSPYPAATSSNSEVTGMYVSYANLTPEEKEIVAYLTKNNTYDADGNIVVAMSPVLQVAVPTPAFSNTTNSTEQAALEQALEAAGLPPPGNVFNTTSSKLAGYCSNGVYVPATRKRDEMLFAAMSAPQQSPARRSNFNRRGAGDVDDESWWDYVWDVACDDITTEIIGAIDEEAGEIAELICDLKELYDDVSEAYAQRDAIKCAFTGCYLDIPPATKWTYTSSWNADFQIPPQPLAYTYASTVSCVDCSLTVSEIQFQGTVQIVTSTGEIQTVQMTPTMSWSSSLVMGLKSTGADANTFNYAFPSLSFPSPVTVPGEFTITPSMIMSLGVSWSTTGAVNFYGGGAVSVNGGSMTLDLQQSTATQFNNWSPTVSYTYPVFNSAATVSWNPIMRTALSIGVQLLNAPYRAQPVYITSATSIGFNAALIESDGGACPAGQLMMTSFSDVSSNVMFSGGSQQLLAPSGNVAGNTHCFSVPNDIPTNDEVKALASVGGAFCTSYIDYNPPTTVSYGVSTTTTLSTVPTTVPTTMTTTSTYYTDITTYTGSTFYLTSPPVSYVYTSGSQSLANSYMKKRGLEIPSATTFGTITKTPAPTVTAQPTKAPTPGQNVKRQVASPTLISTWDASKISLACKQVATGTSTATYYTATTTAYSGTVTATVYSTVFQQGASVATSTVTYYNAYWVPETVTSGAVVTSTTATSCPLQTQVSCFTITGHGPPSVDGKQLYGAAGELSALIFGSWGEGWYPLTFYLNCEGNLVALNLKDPEDPSVLNVVAVDGSYSGWDDDMGGDGGDGYVETVPWGQGTPAVCQKNEVEGIITCGAGWYAMVPPGSTDGDNLVENTDLFNYSPFWVDDWEGNDFVPMYMTYETVTCPCEY